MIRISRQSQYFDSLRNYKIYIDDIYCGDIKNDEIKELDIENGEHVICLKIDWCRSNKLTFIVKYNQLVELNCGNSVKNLNYPLLLIYAAVKKNNYLSIKLTNDI